jgi:hypothetical protein
MTRLCLVISIAWIGCGGDMAQVVGGGPPDGGDDGGLMLGCRNAAPVSLKNDLKPKLGCGGELCHGFLANNPASWWVNKPSTTCNDGRKLVTPGDPTHSYVLDKLTNHDLCNGVAMPKGLDTGWNELPADTLQTLTDWICQGANDN